ncbi:MAG: metal-dependent hydrolase [Chloroflexota bacterium]
MNWPAHILINSALGKKAEERGIRPVYSALIIGSVFPDVPLTVLSVAYIAWHGLGGGVLSGGEAADRAFSELFYNDPFWITSHHLFHAPLLTLLWIGIGYYFGVVRGTQWGKWWLWFSIGTALHSLLDIPTHHDDGPLLLFPFNWDLRYISPVSYWDPDHYGIPFTIFETFISGLLGAFFFKEWRARRQRRKEAKAQNEVAGATS